MNLDSVLVVNFSTGERTTHLSDLCLKKLGFPNIVTIANELGFREKFLECAEIMAKSQFDCLVRTDADRLVYEGVFELLRCFDEDNDLFCVEGQCFDFLMNRYRAATPHIFSKKAMILLHENNSLMPDTQKPESRFIEKVTKNKAEGWKLVNVLTNLHDFDQYPSNVCNTLVNRIFRGHFHSLYDINYLQSLRPEYCAAVNEAARFANSIGYKSNMDYVDFDFLDNDFAPIDELELEKKYVFYRKIFEKRFRDMN